jgi:heme exporter protein A
LDQGHARIAGFDLATERAAVRRNVALLGHHSYLYEALTARENLEIARRFLGAPADRVDALLAEVGLDTRADDPVLAFSTGMRKRLSLARALLQDARVLLLDEPYGELDPAGFALLDRVLDDQRRRGVTVLLATHLLDHGRALCDEAIALEEGRLIWSGPASLLPEPAA